MVLRAKVNCCILDLFIGRILNWFVGVAMAPREGTGLPGNWSVSAS